MGDTKRGRERKGMNKQTQRRLRIEERELEANDEPPSMEDEELRIGE
ncbi:hypothetical protein [Salarchaeum japonicum]|nr:hypothetical protein [Salarchaeum japonicum]